MADTLTYLDDNPLSTRVLLPIAELSPNSFRWKIKARVTNKTSIKRYRNGKGKYFKIDLCDESGEITAIAFENVCDRFYEMIQMNKIYYICDCQLQLANKNFPTLNDYEMKFTFNTVVEEYMEDDSSVPFNKYDFIPICEIASKTPDSILDIIGVCTSVANVQKVKNNLYKKREVTLVDNSGAAIVLTLWRDEAEKFEGTTHSVIAVKGARLKEYDGSMYLSCLSSTMLLLNPDLPDAHKLRDWYDNGGADVEIVNISARAAIFHSNENNWNATNEKKWLTFSDEEASQLNKNYDLLGVLTIAYADNALYKACPIDYCNKKLADLENGFYRCDKCIKEYPNYKFRLLLTGKIADPTGDQIIKAFNESAEAMLGKTSAEMGNLFQNDIMEYVHVFEEVKFKTFVFTLRTKMNTFKGLLETTVMNVQPVDYKEANSRLISSIKSITGVEI